MITEKPSCPEEYDPVLIYSWNRGFRDHEEADRFDRCTSLFGYVAAPAWGHVQGLGRSTKPAKSDSLGRVLKIRALIFNWLLVKLFSESAIIEPLKLKVSSKSKCIGAEPSTVSHQQTKGWCLAGCTSEMKTTPSLEPPRVPNITK